MITPIKPFNLISFKSSDLFNFEPRKISVNHNDTFEKSDIEESVDVDDDLDAVSGQPKNFHHLPNANFLYDKTLSFERKLDILSQHPEILSISSLEKENGFPRGFLMLKDFFYIDKLYLHGRVEDYLINTEDEVNKKNLDRIMSNKHNLLNLAEYASMLGINAHRSSSFYNSRISRKFDLYNKKTGELQKAPLIYIDDKNGRDNIKNAYKIGQTTPFYDRIISSDYPHDIFANVGTLSKLGFGDPKVMYSLIKSGKIDGKIDTSFVDGFKKIRALVDVASKNPKLRSRY